MADTPRNSIDRVVVSKRFRDPQIDPPMFQDEELPTLSKTLRGAQRKGRERLPHGSALGSLRLTGSQREFSPGSYSLRVTRVSLSTGSRNMAWFIRHNRVGTVDVVDFPAPGQHYVVGAPMEPIYAFGPGTVIYGWLGDPTGGFGSTAWVSQHMEGFIGARRPDQV